MATRLAEVLTVAELREVQTADTEYDATTIALALVGERCPDYLCSEIAADARREWEPTWWVAVERRMTERDVQTAFLRRFIRA